jgi:hypothetical protein
MNWNRVAMTKLIKWDYRTSSDMQDLCAVVLIG